MAEANEQISILTVLASLDKNQQTIRLKEIERMPMATLNIQKIQALRNNLETAPARIHSAMVVPRPAIPAEDNYGLSPELLSEKLHDSVKMIKDLMSSNRKLKETINELSSLKKTQDAEIAQLHAENQMLVERMENNNNDGESTAIIKLLEERDELLNKITDMERDKEKQHTPVIFPIKEKKNEWA